MKISNNITSSYNTNISKSKNLDSQQTFGAKNPANKLNQFFKLDKAGPMSRKLFILNAFTFLLGSRIITSRDKDEKRETVIRDIPTIIVSVAGVPALEKATAQIIERKTGFTITEKALNSKGKTVTSNINYPTINSWYKYEDNIKGGMNAFTQRLSDMGGNVKKICSSLSDNIKNQIKDYSGNNAEFIKQLKNNEKLSSEIAKAFSEVGNKAAKKAELLKTGSKVAGFGATLLIVGLIIPKLNMLITNAIHKNDAKKEEVKQDTK